jgi:DNA-directed RNA polymerase subunit K/omega
LRAKQLRRGARPRLDQSPDGSHNQPHKPERVAMEEVRRRLVYYDLPPAKAPGGQAA